MSPRSYITRLRERWGPELLLTPAVAACIRDAQGRILLLKRSDVENLWGFPGGFMEPGERASEAVVREVREETALEVEPGALIGIYSGPEFAFAYPNGDQVQPVTIFFECQAVGGELDPDREEILEGRYFGPEDDLPPMRRCCIAKAGDAFSFAGQVFFR